MCAKPGVGTVAADRHAMTGCAAPEKPPAAATAAVVINKTRMALRMSLCRSVKPIRFFYAALLEGIISSLAWSIHERLTTETRNHGKTRNLACLESMPNGLDGVMNLDTLSCARIPMAGKDPHQKPLLPFQCFRVSVVNFPG